MTVAISARPGKLREAAEEIERRSGLRVQIIGGALVMSPTPRGKHAGTIRRLRMQLDPALPEGLAPYEVSSVAMPDDPDDYATPDLAVLPLDWEEDDDWLADPGEVAFAVEVISKSERAKDLTNKTEWYATAGVAVLLVVDPRNGTWTLCTQPRDGKYRGTVDGAYGDDIALPAPLSTVLTTNNLPLYGH